VLALGKLHLWETDSVDCLLTRYFPVYIAAYNVFPPQLSQASLEG